MGWRWGMEIVKKRCKNYNDTIIMIATRCSGKFTPSSDNWGGATCQNMARCSFISVPPHTCPPPLPAKLQRHFLYERSLTTQCHFCFLPGTSILAWKTLYPVSFESANPESSSLRTHMEPILSSVYPWPRAGMMNGSCQWCIVSLAACEFCRPSPSQLAMCWDLSAHLAVTETN